MSRRPEAPSDGFMPFLDAFLLEDRERMGIFVEFIERIVRDLVRKALTVRL